MQTQSTGLASFKQFMLQFQRCPSACDFLLSLQQHSTTCLALDSTEMTSCSALLQHCCQSCSQLTHDCLQCFWGVGAAVQRTKGGNSAGDDSLPAVGHGQGCVRHLEAAPPAADHRGQAQGRQPSAHAGCAVSGRLPYASRTERKAK